MRHQICGTTPALGRTLYTVHRTCGLIALSALLALLSGCARPQAPEPVLDAEPPPPKSQVIAYINVASGCQEPTVELVNALAEEYADVVTLEMVDFGSPEGEKRWHGDGMDCMGFLFNGSPVLRFPGEDGTPKTVAFLMPAGFGWTHEDLEEAFAALRAGTAEILSEEEARRELAPRPVTVELAVREVNGSAEILMNGNPLFMIRAEADGKTPAQRAQGARAGLEAWTEEPVHPSQLTVARDEDETFRIMAGGNEVIQVTDADVAAAGFDEPQDLIEEWVSSIKAGIVEAVRKTHAQ